MESPINLICVANTVLGCWQLTTAKALNCASVREAYGKKIVLH